LLATVLATLLATVLATAAAALATTLLGSMRRRDASVGVVARDDVEA
tara:strand:- start:929 stop:1069 length:141 start_codon:yes stop_codon:yes gene_type:complete